jgi:predicted transcriptional regulator
MKELHRLTDLQIALLDPIWERGEATVRDVHAVQVERLGLALKTVGTVLRRLEGQGILEHREEGRQFVYRTLVSREEVREATMRATADSLFAGSVADLVTHALKDGSVDDGELAEIRRVVHDLAVNGHDRS